MRRHGAPQQHGDHGRASPFAAAASSCSTRSSHEFFHSWNVERIRPKSLEPFNLDDANMSGELWLAEGFTSYFGAAGDAPRRPDDHARARAGDGPGGRTPCSTSPGRRVRTAEEMSQQAPFVDAATAIDRTSFENTFISYYTWGEAIGLALDLSLRERTAGRATLDALHARDVGTVRQAGRRAGLRGPALHDRRRPGGAGRRWRATPDVRASSSSHATSRGTRRPTTRRCSSAPGCVLRPLNPGLPYAGGLQLQTGSDGVRVATDVPFDSPAFAAGLEREDRILSIGGTPVTTESTVREAICAAQAGRRGADRVRAPRRRARHLDAASRGRPARGGRHRRGRRPARSPAPSAVSAGPGSAATGSGSGRSRPATPGPP